ncbi:MAG: DUF2520 domain-containing protein [Actinomycetota bacterium]|jgi:predicted short-subunit dehydrogenase-like oxidoreductase (DUF2520 family)|nr:DUF2520 domain-containing protein [Actinomycetota bacterium]
MAAALAASGVFVRDLLGRRDDPRLAAVGVDAVVLATPDGAVAAVAAAIEPSDGAVVLHLSGSLGLDVLAPHPRVGSLHPLVPLPDPEIGMRRLLSGATFAVDGDPLAAELVRRLGGRALRVDPRRRAAYHAAACMASNHVVALLGQVERVAASAGLGLDAFIDLARFAVDDVAERGTVAALTGPAARGDVATLDRHRAALDPEEVAAYDAMVGLARRLAGRGALDPDLLHTRRAMSTTHQPVCSPSVPSVPSVPLAPVAPVVPVVPTERLAVPCS